MVTPPCRYPADMNPRLSSGIGCKQFYNYQLLSIYCINIYIYIRTTWALQEVFPADNFGAQNHLFRVQNHRSWRVLV